MSAWTISSNGASVNQQAADALGWLRLVDPEAYCEVRKHFPEDFIWKGAWLDTEAMGVDVEWASWLIDAIEDTGLVVWFEGEPWGSPSGDFSALSDDEWRIVRPLDKY